MSNLEVFNKIRSDLTLLVEKNKGLTINGVNDIVGYQRMKEAKNEIRKGEIELEKLAKSEREGALNWQREILRLEKELKEITSPSIASYSEILDEYEKLKSREERLALLPSRKKSLEEIFVNLSDEEILDLDDKKFSELYSKLKLDYLEKKDNEEKAIKHNLYLQRKEQLIPYWNFLKEDHRGVDYSELPQESFDIILREVKKYKEEFDKEQVEKDKLIKKQREEIEEQQKKQAEIDKKEKEEADKKVKQEAQLKDEKIQNWLKENNYNPNEYKLFNDGSKMTLYKKISELEIK